MKYGGIVPFRLANVSKGRAASAFGKQYTKELVNFYCNTRQHMHKIVILIAKGRVFRNIHICINRLVPTK